MSDYDKWYDGCYPSAKFHPVDAPTGKVWYYPDKKTADLVEAEMAKHGWVDTPALFSKQETKTQDNSVTSQEIPNLEGLSNREAKNLLESWASNRGIELDKRKSLDKLKAECEAIRGDADADG